MFDDVEVNHRVSKRHPEISSDDVISTVTNEQMEQLANMFERGEWPEGETRVLRGRPLMFDEELQPITFKEPKRKVQAIDRRADQLGMSRSSYLRHLVDRDLATA